MLSVPFFDTHVHLWDPQRLRHPWLTNVPILRRPFLLADLEPGAHTVDGVVVVEAGCAPAHAVEEVAWVEGLARLAPIPILGMVAQVPLERGRGAAPTIEAAAARHLVVGVRRNVQDERPGFLLDDGLVAGIQALGEAGLPFDACVRAHQLPELIDLVDRCPDVTFVLDHLGKPAIRDGAFTAWAAALATLGTRGRVYAKLSGLTTEADPAGWHPDDVAPYLIHALRVFGPERCLFGSDWPVATLATTYDRWVDVVAAAVSDVAIGTATRDTEAVFRGTARRAYPRLRPLPAPKNPPHPLEQTSHE